MQVIDKEQQLKTKTQQTIQAAMREFREGGVFDPPNEVIDSAHYNKLTRLQIDQGVIAMVLQLNLSGGSVGEVDLYRLIRSYLWDEETRVEINKIVDGVRLSYN
jgi:hypothetical protein